MKSRRRLALGCVALTLLGALLSVPAIGYLTNRPATFDVVRHVGSFVGGFVGVFGLLCVAAGLAGLVAALRGRS
jgi:hypothetical protein